MNAKSYETFPLYLSIYSLLKNKIKFQCLSKLQISKHIYSNDKKRVQT